MTNAEKYIKEEVVNTQGERFVYEYKEWLKNQNKLSSIEIDRQESLLAKFLCEQVKPTLSEDEKAILRELPEKYTYIGRRDGTPSIELYIKSDDDFKHCWCFYNHLFQFIQERRRI